MTWTPLTNSELPERFEELFDRDLEFMMPTGAAQLDAQSDRESYVIFKHNGHAYGILIDAFRQPTVVYKVLDE